MNANELADELKDMCIAMSVEEHWVPVLSEASTMLRQQQSEIEALKTFDGGQTICPSCGCKSLYKTNRSEWCVTHKCLWQSDYDLELTDEEIIAEAEKHDWLGLTSESEWQPEIEFAKAILRKAQEK